MSIVNQLDTLQFELGENMYNDIKSFNCFIENGIQYLSFYDRRSESIYIYYLLDQRLYKIISLKKLFNNRQLYKTSVYFKNWDSIFIINKFTLSLYDSSGHRKKKIEFPPDPDNAAAIFDSNKLPVFIDNKLYALIRNRVDYRSTNALREWQVLYAFDLEKEKVQPYYHLPEIYQKHLYGDYFLDYNYCYNNRSKFVFSFPADTLLYETDLVDYNYSYFARSQMQTKVISPVDKQALQDGQSLKEYAIRDSYGPIFFDSYKHIYLRLVRHKLTQEEFLAKKRKKETVLILNENLQVIGESDWPKGLDFESILFTPEGRLYARANFKDENALHFVRVDYQDNKENSIQLSRN